MRSDLRLHDKPGVDSVEEDKSGTKGFHHNGATINNHLTRQPLMTSLHPQVSRQIDARPERRSLATPSSD